MTSPTAHLYSQKFVPYFKKISVEEVDEHLEKSPTLRFKDQVLELM